MAMIYYRMLVCVVLVKKSGNKKGKIIDLAFFDFGSLSK